MANLLRPLALRVAWGYLGTPYKWGGDDPSGLDCSGFMIEILKSVGRFPRKGDATAGGLLSKFMGAIKADSEAEPGDLVFWRRGGRVVHVEMVVQVDGSEIYSIGASGGGSQTKTEDDAWRQNAYIKVRPVKSRGGTRIIADPFANMEGTDDD